MGKFADQAICTSVLRRRYAHEGELCADDVLRRVARALSELESSGQRAHWHRQFLWALRHGLVPAGRVLAGAGGQGQGMLINCFVLPVNSPSNVNGLLGESRVTLEMGGGVGYDLSPLAPVGADVGAVAVRAVGPVAALHELDDACSRACTSRHRPGAQMAVLRCDHPDVLSFIHAKDRPGLSTFNLSVALSEAFMQAVVADSLIELVHSSKPGGVSGLSPVRHRDDGMWVYASVRARAIWQEILQSAYEHGEPGVLFMDRINAENNLSYCEQIRATNPCAEQPLPPYGACCLASIDLTRLVEDPFGLRPRMRHDHLATLVKVAIRLLDNVLDLTTWPLSAQMVEARLKRRIGLGITGLGDALVMLGLRYDSEAACNQVAQWMATIRDVAYLASCELATQRGSFPLFDAEAFLKAPHFASRLPADIQAAIRRKGLRHAHLLAVAPAGSISLALCDNVSSGIEPVFAWQLQRSMSLPNDGGQELFTVDDHAWRLYRHLKGTDAAMGDWFVTAHQIAPVDQVAMVAAVAPFVDGGISKTVNVRADLPQREFEAIYMQAWRTGLKGLATYRPNATLPPILRAASCGSGHLAC